MVVPVLVVLYNITLTCILTFAIACTFFLHLRKRGTTYIALGIMFCAYLVDNMIVFCTESIPRFAEAYDNMFVTTPSLKTVYFILLMGCMLYAFSGSIIPTLSLPALIGLLGVYAAILICVPMISQNNWMVFFYYLPTQLLIMGISLRGLVRLHKKSTEQQLFSHADVKRILVFLLVMSVLVLVEDTIVIFFVDSYNGPGLKIQNRNISENILFLGLALYIIYHARKLLKPSPDDGLGALSSSLYPGKTPMKAFGLAYSLTDREQEVLQRVLDGKSQQEISEELIIALGTVKTHIHNIYQKANVANRSQMIVKFQEFNASTAKEAASREPTSS